MNKFLAMLVAPAVLVVPGLTVALLLSGCNQDAKTYDASGSYILPDGMKDCRVFYMVGRGSAENILMVRCPHSETATQYSVTRYNPATKMDETTTYRSTVVETQ